MSGLDPFGRSDIADLIKNLKQAGKTILFCSHILEDVDRLVDKVLVLHKGKNLFYGEVSALCSQQQSVDFVRSYLNIVQTEEGHEKLN
jgi:ABC-2 type transport system ATP-binding protein